MSTLEWAQYWQTRDPAELIDFDDTRYLDELKHKASVRHMVSCEQRMTRRGEVMWLLRDTQGDRHYLFANKIEDKSPYYWLWHWQQMSYDELKRRTQTGSIRFDPPIPMYIMPNKDYSHVHAPLASE